MTRPVCISLCVLVIFLAACSGSGATPQLIASYPSNQVGVPAPGGQMVYSSYLTIEVANPDRAAEQAASLAEKLGGYLARSDSWLQNDRLATCVTLAVPASNYTALRSALLRLGTLVSEQTSGDWQPGSYAWDAYSQITVTFQPKPQPWPQLDPSSSGWNPLSTFRQAFGVFWGIFGFIVDILIWVLVVAGPFAALAIGAWALARRLRRG